MEVLFYSGASDKLYVACRLCAKALTQNARVMIYSTDAVTLDKMDKLLWTYQQTSFLPHCSINDDETLIGATPIVLSSRLSPAYACTILFNLDTHCPQQLEQFERIIEIASASPGDKQAARERYRFYKQAGYTLRHHDLTKH